METNLNIQQYVLHCAHRCTGVDTGVIPQVRIWYCCWLVMHVLVWGRGSNLECCKNLDCSGLRWIALDPGAAFLCSYIIGNSIL